MAGRARREWAVGGSSRKFESVLTAAGPRAGLDIDPNAEAQRPCNNEHLMTKKARDQLEHRLSIKCMVVCVDHGYG
jgi:hypothetical protein